MFSLYITILALLPTPAHPVEVIERKEIHSIISAEECERAAAQFRLQGLENPKVQVVSVCIKKG